MDTVKRFRVMAVRIALFILAVSAAIAFAFSRVVAHGLLLGGLAGVLVFWVTALRSERLLEGGAKQIRGRAFLWTFGSILVYALALVRAYMLDRIALHGLIAAAAGLFVIRLAAVFLGLTGLDLDKGDK